jgi:cyclophilin family peptidyl-prolyl cis-trans isomerase
MVKYRFTVITVLLLSLFQATGAVAANPKVRITTNLGAIEVELYQDKSPISVKNFLQYVDSGFYSNVLFHRVISNFMIQGGGYTTDYQAKDKGDPIQNESYNGLKNLEGTLSMARTSRPHTASSQFFINTRDNSFLDFEVAPYGPLNTVRQSELGIRDIVTGRMATTNCRGQRITRNTLKEAAAAGNNADKGYICLMQAILNDNDYSLETGIKSCLSQAESLKENGKLGKDQTCSDYVNSRHQSLELVHIRWGYAVFGRVTKGYEVVETIENTETGAAGPFRKDAPLEQVVIQSIERIE